MRIHGRSYIAINYRIIYSFNIYCKTSYQTFILMDSIKLMRHKQYDLSVSRIQAAPIVVQSIIYNIMEHLRRMISWAEEVENDEKSSVGRIVAVAVRYSSMRLLDRSFYLTVLSMNWSPCWCYCSLDGYRCYCWLLRVEWLADCSRYYCWMEPQHDSWYCATGSWIDSWHLNG